MNLWLADPDAPPLTRRDELAYAQGIAGLYVGFARLARGIGDTDRSRQWSLRANAIYARLEAQLPQVRERLCECGAWYTPGWGGDDLKCNRCLLKGDNHV
jgi:hypothetical protein